MVPYKGMPEDSIIKLYKNSIDVNLVGSYTRALEIIPNKSPLLKGIIDDRRSIGRMGSYLISRRMLFNDADFEDYFVKRLVLTEIVY